MRNIIDYYYRHPCHDKVTPIEKECVSFPFNIGPMEIMPLSKPYDHNGLWDVKSLTDPEKSYRKDSNQIV